MSKKIETKSNAATKHVKEKTVFVFEKQNYMLLILSIVIIAIGFVLMYGKENIYDFRKITLAPIVVVIGLLTGIFAILYKAKKAE